MSAPQQPQNIVVIGGGIIGCTTAYYLTHHPRFDPSIHTVTLIEAGNLATSASGKAGGLVAAWAYPNNLARLSFNLHDQLSRDHNGAEQWGYRRVHCGQLSAVASQRQNIDQRELRSRRSINLGKIWARDPKTSSTLPQDLDWFNDESTRGYEALADPSSTAQVQPYQFTSSMATLSAERGAKYITGQVMHINCSNLDDPSGSASPLADSDHLASKKVVSVTYVDKTSKQQFSLPASAVVLAAGPWTPTLLPKVRMQPLRAHSVTIKLQKPVSAYCLFSDIQASDPGDPGAVARSISLEIYPRPNNEVYICSQGDLDVDLPSPGSSTEVSSQQCQDIINAATSISSELQSGQVTGRRACYLPVLDDNSNSLPLVGPTELEGLVLATGHSCWGISNATGTGKAISELLLDGHIACIDATNLDPRRR